MKLKDKVAIVTGGAHGIGVRDCPPLRRRRRARHHCRHRCRRRRGRRAQPRRCPLRGRRRRRRAPGRERDCRNLPRVRRSRRPGEQCRHHSRRRFPRPGGSRFRPRAAGESQGRVPGRPGRRPAHGRAGQGRQAAGQHHQHELDQCRGRDRQPRALLRVEGRHGPVDQGDGAGARALRHPGQRHRAGLDHDRHPQGGRDRPGGEAPDTGAHAARAHRRARRDRVDRRSSSLRRTQAMSPARPSMPTAAGSR